MGLDGSLVDGSSKPFHRSKLQEERRMWLAMESTVSSYKSWAYIKMSAKVHKVSREKFRENKFFF